MSCVFCGIVNGDIPSKKVYEDETVLAFYDIDPKAPTHILVIPKAHVACGACEITPDNSAVVAHVFEVIAKLTREMNLGDFRVVTNNGEGAGQTVPHLHFHILAGRVLGEMG